MTTGDGTRPGDLSSPAAPYWPLFGLALRTPELHLRPVSDDDLPELVELALAGVHDPGLMPFAVQWTVGTPQQVGQGMAQYFWRRRADWTPQRWALPLAVRRAGTMVGVQRDHGDSKA